jgi:DMSO/TMAO reductase YedYZ heme-binding membrane subunit
LRYRLTSNQAVLKTHSVTTSIIGFSALLIHIGSLYLGQLVFLSPSILGTPIFPGIAAFGICTVLILTSHYRGRIVKMKLWRLIHYSSFLFYVLMSVHAVMSGTDSANPLIRLVYIVSFLLVGTLMVARFLGPKTFVSPIDRT